MKMHCVKYVTEASARYSSDHMVAQHQRTMHANAGLSTKGKDVAIQVGSSHCVLP